ncbi:hypothetical protein LZ31DRAFT_323216 [Colletotrichum somersetense]|nr:hypothetical protein LZ31DRAFT_323216 [Colletotrichum somersetense]
MIFALRSETRVSPPFEYRWAFFFPGFMVAPRPRLCTAPSRLRHAADGASAHEARYDSAGRRILCWRLSFSLPRGCKVPLIGSLAPLPPYALPFAGLGQTCFLNNRDMLSSSGSGHV